MPGRVPGGPPGDTPRTPQHQTTACSRNTYGTAGPSRSVMTLSRERDSRDPGWVSTASSDSNAPMPYQFPPSHGLSIGVRPAPAVRQPQLTTTAASPSHCGVRYQHPLVVFTQEIYVGFL